MLPYFDRRATQTLLRGLVMRHFSTSFFWAAMLLSTAACASTRGPSGVQEGMSRQMLMSVMGAPDDRIAGRNYSALKWTETDESGTDVSFWAILQDDVVVATGFGELREEGGRLAIVPLRR